MSSVPGVPTVASGVVPTYITLADDQPNWEPAGDPMTIMLNTPSPISIFGMRTIQAKIVNIGTNNVTFANQSTEAPSSFRFITNTGNSLVLLPGHAMEVIYDDFAGRARCWLL
jgi:hypothetical protein